MPTEQTDLETWVGRTEVRADQVTPVPLAALNAMLDREGDPRAEFVDAIELDEWIRSTRVDAGSIRWDET